MINEQIFHIMLLLLLKAKLKSAHICNRSLPHGDLYMRTEREREKGVKNTFDYYKYQNILHINIKKSLHRRAIASSPLYLLISNNDGVDVFYFYFYFCISLFTHTHTHNTNTYKNVNYVRTLINHLQLEFCLASYIDTYRYFLKLKRRQNRRQEMNTRRSTNDWFNIGNDTRSASSSSSTAAPSSSSPLFCSGLNNGPSVLNSSVPIRLAFLRKVYSILFVQLGLTTLISSSIMFMTPIQMFIGRK